MQIVGCHERVRGIARERGAADRKHRLAEQQPAAGHAALGHVPHGEVDAGSLEVVDHLVGRGDAHVDVRMIAREASEVRYQP